MMATQLPAYREFTPSESARAAFQAMLRCTEDERAEVMAWFCRGCLRYIGPGEHCHCSNDE